MSTSRDDFGIAIRSALLKRGARQKFSLFFLICFSIIIFILDIYPISFIDKSRAFLNDAIYRVSSVGTSPFRFFSYLKKQTSSHILVHKENKILKEELEVLKQKNHELEYLTSELKNMEKLLEIEENENKNFIISKVLLDKESPFLKSIIVNKGSRAGIKKGMPVLDGNNLVGRVVEVNFLSSRVLLLNDLNSKIPITFEASADQAILSGTGDKMPKLQYLPELFEANEGTTIFTSGKDGVFLPGIPVGKTILDDDKILVKLFADPNQLSFVNIITENLWQ